MAAWTGEALIGLAGWTALRRSLRTVGLAAIALHAALGFDGLRRYALAPVGAHARAMNLTIGLEAATAAAPLTVTAAHLFSLRRPGAV